MKANPMRLLTTTGWTDYQLLDSGEGSRLEKFGKFKIMRPDPQAIWKRRLGPSVWANCDASYISGGKSGKWIYKKGMPQEWPIKYEDISLFCRLTPFKHTGIFPEQQSHWDWIKKTISKCGFQPNILNLFGYTGAATLVAASAGAKVTHVDASYQAIGWARKNQENSSLKDKPIRWILDDVVKFIKRELKRGTKYDGILMDPPTYGHGPNGEVWNFDRMFPELTDICVKLLTSKPLFVIVNAYADAASNIMLQNVMADYMTNLAGTIESGELIIQESGNGRLFSTGIYARWSGTAQ